VKLTGNVVRTYTLPEGKIDKIIFDDKLKGFGLRVRPTGRLWLVQYRDAMGSDRRFNIGSTHEVTASQARETAAKLLAGIKLGKFPHIEREKARQAAQHDLDRSRKTFGSIAELYLARQRGELRPRSFVGTKSHVERSWACFHKVPVDQITQRMIAQRLEEITRDSGKVSANRARGILHAFYTWACKSHLVEGGNPVTYTLRNKETPRRHTLNEAELRAVWLAAGDDAFGRIVKLLLLTACRRSEISHLRWSEVDLAKGELMIPAERMKGGMPHMVPLSREAVAILESTPRVGDAVFGKGRGFEQFGLAKRKLDARIAETGAPVRDWHLHDLRRTVRTALTGTLRILENVAEAVIAHARPGIKGVYDVGEYADQKREALTAWAAYFDAVVTGRDRKIVQMPLKVPA
jgi:integrase